MKSFEELFEIAKKLEAAAATGDAEAVSVPLTALADAPNKVGRSFSGSWLGYHSRVYYEGLVPAPAGANFSQEWGLKDLSFTSLGSQGNWQEYRFDEVVNHIRKVGGKPDLTTAHAAAQLVEKVFDTSKSEIISIFETELAKQSDPFLSKLKNDVEKLEPMSKMDMAELWSPKGQVMTRDMIAMGQGSTVPPHIDLLAEVASTRQSFAICRAAANIAQKAASHLERKGRNKIVADRIGTNVFIGHGRSSAWRELKDKTGSVCLGMNSTVYRSLVSQILRGYTMDAKKQCRDEKIGLYKIRDFMAALNRPELWSYLDEREIEHFNGKGWL